MKQHAPHTLRNRDPILQVLREVLPQRGNVLEIASGTGEHIVHFAERLPELTWQPSDMQAAALESVEAHVAEAELPNLRRPLRIDVRDDDWGIVEADAIVCINMVHISPWESCEALMRGAARLLPPEAPLVLYGPYRFDGRFTAPSNASFDQALRQRDPSFGVRDASDVTRAAQDAGFERIAIRQMPANNHMLIFRRSGGAGAQR